MNEVEPVIKGSTFIIPKEDKEKRTATITVRVDETPPEAPSNLMYVKVECRMEGDTEGYMNY